MPLTCKIRFPKLVGIQPKPVGLIIFSIKRSFFYTSLQGRLIIKNILINFSFCIVVIDLGEREYALLDDGGEKKAELQAFIDRAEDARSNFEKMALRVINEAGLKPENYSKFFVYFSRDDWHDGQLKADVEKFKLQIGENFREKYKKNPDSYLCKKVGSIIGGSLTLEALTSSKLALECVFEKVAVLLSLQKKFSNHGSLFLISYCNNYGMLDEKFFKEDEVYSDSNYDRHYFEKIIKIAKKQLEVRSLMMLCKVVFFEEVNKKKNSKDSAANFDAEKIFSILEYMYKKTPSKDFALVVAGAEKALEKLSISVEQCKLITPERYAYLWRFFPSHAALADSASRPRIEEINETPEALLQHEEDSSTPNSCVKKIII